ncbi:peroxidase-like isoform X2 [Trichoplusia ni]|uniref:Peroxidase-like isoform X2 n=1 Tax=Trichoplusia ni TaxID=7111 RepID=A0A7E5WH54_TRINI|nr:peroxidase-like isoform X2 [Trichoplusia ni]
MFSAFLSYVLPQQDRKAVIMLKFIYLFNFCWLLCGVHAVVYDSITGEPATEAQLNYYRERNNLEICTVNIKPCDKNEWKRLDGSCNNLKYPSVGTQRTPTTRILPPILGPNYNPVDTVDGKPFPLARRVRCELLSEGKASDLTTTQLVSYYTLFASADINSLHDVFNYMQYILYCCEEKGKFDYMCTPNKIPKDDPVHRYSGIRCMNLTRPESFQTHGCLENGTTFVRMTTATPVFDLSQVYNAMTTSEDLRVYKNGLVKMEIDHGKLFPPSTNDSGNCFLNEPPRETRCNRAHFNTAIGPVFFAIIFYRYHNFIANELHALNPCWDDDRLYYTARDINIAISMQILYYEVMPILMGRENMIRDGIILDHDGFRDWYDEDVLPQMSDEFPYSLRWLHTIQEADVKLYDGDGYYLNTVPMINVSLRTGWLPLDYNMEKFTQGSFRQFSGAYDHIIDFDMSERVLGGISVSSDVSTSDLSKGRYFGLQPYVNYRQHCTGRSYTTFWHLKDAISTEVILSDIV